MLALTAAVLRWVLNNALVLAAVRLDDPASRIRDLLGGRDGLYNDVAECCVGVLVALCAAVSPLMLIVALPCGTLLQRSSRHSQLIQASRTDPKTGLLSAATWQHEAAVQVARAIRARAPLAVAMIDIDHFKRVNDTYGHLAGDAVLAEVARVLSAGLRGYDLAGRFGGEEFTLLLPDADEAEALRIAERLRASLGEIPVRAGEAPRITVSIGVAAIVGGIADLTDLLAAADTALYRARTPAATPCSWPASRRPARNGRGDRAVTAMAGAPGPACTGCVPGEPPKPPDTRSLTRAASSPPTRTAPCR